MASPTSNSTSCLLSPLDQLMPVTYNRVILAFTTDVDVEVDVHVNVNDDRRTPTPAIDALRQGLETTCSQLPYLKGRVVDADSVRLHQEQKQGGGGRLAISWSEQDPVPALQEIERPTEIPNSYAQLKREGLPSRRLPQSLCPVAGWVAQDFPDGTVGAPVIAASYTCLDGGILVTLCVHHSVMDGTGTGQLISLWGRNCRSTGKGSGELDFSGPLLPLPEAQEPQHRLERLKADTLTTCEVGGGSGGSHPTPRDDSGHNNSFESLLALHPEYTTVPPTGPKLPVPPCTSKIFIFPVDKLKSTAIASNTSVNNVLCAIIWSCITTVRSMRRQKESTVSSDLAPTPTQAPAKVKLGMAVNGRPRIGGSFAARDREQPYLGNVNLYCVTSLDLNVLTTMGGGELYTPSPNKAKSEAHSASSSTEVFTPIFHALSTSIARIDRAFISEVITLSEHAPNIKTLFPGWDFFNGPDLTITSWANLDTYAVDFGLGLGTPDFVRVPCIEGVDGLNIVLPRRRGGESVGEMIEVVVMLRRDDMGDLEGNAVWRDWTVGWNEVDSA